MGINIFNNIYENYKDENTMRSSFFVVILAICFFQKSKAIKPWNSLNRRESTLQYYAKYNERTRWNNDKPSISTFAKDNGWLNLDRRESPTKYYAKYNERTRWNNDKPSISTFAKDNGWLNLDRR